MTALGTHIEPVRGEAIARLEEELASRDARIAELEARMQDLVYVASHDLVEPLRMVRSFLQLLERRNAGQLDERSEQFIAFAVDGADRMKTLLDDLLRYSRTASTDLAAADVALDELMRGVLAGLRAPIVESGATVTVADDLPTVCADAVLMGQLMTNLVANAVRFHPADRGNAVHVGAERDETASAWRLVVADDGIGFDESQTERIFKPFQRLHSRDDYPGSGIGLAICRRIAERHGATVTCSSILGRGSRFELVLPDRRPGVRP